MKVYRCYNCVGDNGTPGKDFEGDAPKCPHCGVDVTGNPRLAGLIVALEVIHFDAPSPVRGVGVGFRACNPKRRLPDGDGMDKGTRFTGHPAAVTCPDCKKSAAYLIAHGGLADLVGLQPGAPAYMVADKLRDDGHDAEATTVMAAIAEDSTPRGK